MKVKKTKSTLIIDIILNAVIALTTAAAISVYFCGVEDALGGTGSQCLKFFTTDSNIVVAVAAVIMAVFGIRKLKDPNTETPEWAVILKQVGTVSVSVTLITVVLFLAPTSEYPTMLFAGNMFVLHLSTPVLSIVSFLFFEKEWVLRKRQLLFSMIPVAAYSVVYGVLVISGIWDDWYGLTFGGRMAAIPIVVVVMYAFNLFVSWLEWKIRKRIIG